MRRQDGVGIKKLRGDEVSLVDAVTEKELDARIARADRNQLQHRDRRLFSAIGKRHHAAALEGGTTMQGRPFGVAQVRQHGRYPEMRLPVIWISFQGPLEVLVSLF